MEGLSFEQSTNGRQYVAGDIEQVVLDTNEAIFDRIVRDLRNAHSEILVATAWFTDKDLFELLLLRVRDGIKVEIIIADNQENYKLPFEQLTNAGATVLRVKNVGYGIMHQKFCIIDRKTALYGSYNWSVNARKNNHESIMSTNHTATVETLLKTFLNIKEKALITNSTVTSTKNTKKWFNKLLGIGRRTKDKLLNTKAEQDDNGNKPNEESHSIVIKSEYETILDSMIAAEIGDFDRTIVREHGYNRAKLNNGDSQVLDKSLDSLYSMFINDINVVEDKKKRLLAKIEDQRAKNLGYIDEHLTLKINSIETEFALNSENIKSAISDTKSKITNKNSEITRIKDEKIKSLQLKNQAIEAEIKEAERSFIKPSIKIYELIPEIILASVLLVYLIFFYSSAAYILLFSKLDALNAYNAGNTLPPAEVYNPNAFILAKVHGGTTLAIILLFVVVPISFAILGRHIKNKIWGFILSIILGVFIIDATIAYKVTHAIYESDYLMGYTNDTWNWKYLLGNIDFYLVFIMGAFGLLLFKASYDRLITIFDKRNPDEAANKNKLIINQHRNDIETNNETISGYKEEIIKIEKEITELVKDIEIYTSQLNFLPINKNLLLENATNNAAIKKQSIVKSTDIRISHIENDNFPISVNALKDRINVFIEGWNDYLHNEYAVAKATLKSQEAFERISNWLNEKVTSGQLSKIITL